LFTSQSVSLGAKTVSKPQLIHDTPFKRTPSFPIEKLPAALPRAHIDDSVDHSTIISLYLEQLDQSKPECFTEDAIWRDLYALTGTQRTFYGSKCIKSVWTELYDIHHPSGFATVPASSNVVRLDDHHSWIQARFSFYTNGQPDTICSGHIGLAPGSVSGWKIWLLTTILEEIKGFPNPDFMNLQTENRNSNGDTEQRNSWDFNCVVVGAGFAGLCLAGRLKAMRVPSVTLERNAHIGDNWRNRYESAWCKPIRSMCIKGELTSLTVHTSKDYSRQKYFQSLCALLIVSSQVTCPSDAYSLKKIHISPVPKTLLEDTRNMLINITL